MDGWRESVPGTTGKYELLINIFLGILHINFQCLTLVSLTYPHCVALVDWFCISHHHLLLLVGNTTITTT